uniref:BHLH domain-containing protein n=1 Tax=Aegilops tauschii subsp. strangulata TaxID=200361 RepID=A0A453HXV1_AEGTS
ASKDCVFRCFRNQNLGMVADAQSSDSMAGSSGSAAEKHVDRCLDKRAQEKAPKKNHKAEREKLKRDQLNDLFVELSSMLDHDRQNRGKATVLGDVARVLRDLITQVESLRKEQSTLLTERQYVASRPQELQLFPGTSASTDRECSGHRSNPATSSLADSLPGQLRLSLPPTSQEESSGGGGGAPGNRKERKTS